MNAKTAAMGAGAALVLGVVLIVLMREPEVAPRPGKGSGQGAQGAQGEGGRAGAGKSGPVATKTGGQGTTPVDPLPVRPVEPGPGGTGNQPPVRPVEPAPAQPPGALALRIRARDEKRGPLANVLIEAFLEGGAVLGEVRTDPSGGASVRQIPSGQRVQGRARHPRSRDTVQFGPLDPAQQPEIELVFPHSPTGRMRGRIVDDQGAPVREAELVLKDERQEGKAVVPAGEIGLVADGSFACEVAAGRYAVAARGKGLGLSELTYVSVPADGEVDAGQLVVSRQGTIAGRVALPPDLAAVLPVQLDLVLELTKGTQENPYTTVFRRPLTVDASFAFEVPELDPGAWRLRLEVPAAGQNRVGPWVSCQLPPGQRVDRIELGLGAVQVSLRGTVRDDRGDPIVGARVACRGRYATTDRDGRYGLAGLDPGDCFVEVKHAGHAPGFKQVLYEGAELVLDFQLGRTGVVRGQVNDAKGPAAGVPVLVVTEVNGAVRPFETTTDAQGFWEVPDLPPGSYYIKAGRGADAFDRTGAPTVEVRPGDVVDAPPITLP